MATVHVAFTGAMGGGAPVYAPKPSAAAAITASTTSAATTITADGGDYACVTAIDATVYVVIGPAPTATSAGHCITEGGSKDFGPLKRGDKVAVITLA